MELQVPLITTKAIQENGAGSLIHRMVSPVLWALVTMQIKGNFTSTVNFQVPLIFRLIMMRCCRMVGGMPFGLPAM